MTLSELGAQLRQQREARGLSHEDVATRLKIARRLLQAIEDGEEDFFPHAVYARGFIKAYGGFLGMDEAFILEAIDAIYPIVIQEDLISASGVEASPRDRGRKAGLILTAGLLACGILFAGFWYHKQKTAREQMPMRVAEPAPVETMPPAPVLPTQDDAFVQQEAEATPGGVVQPDVARNATAPARNATLPQANATAVPAANRTAPVGVTAPAAPAGAAVPAVASAAPAGAGTPVVAPSAAGTAAAQGVATLPGSLPLEGAQHNVVLVATGDCWVHASTDSADVRQFSLKKGQSFALAFNRSLTLKVGNAGGIRIRYDGQDMPAQGGEGQVKTLVFPPAQ